MARAAFTTAARGLLPLAMVSLAACSAPPKTFQSEAPQPARQPLADGGEADGAVYVDLIARMLDQRQYYAALAHIEEHRLQQADSPRLRLYEARALLGLGYDGQAQAILLGMTEGPLAAEAHHGLGLIHAKTDLGRALPHFVHAVRQRPTNVTMRNDLGYALMQLGRYRDAQLQLSTALELEPDNERARDNLMLLMLRAGDGAAARELAHSSGMSRSEFDHLQREARALQPSPTRN